MDELAKASSSIVTLPDYTRNLLKTHITQKYFK
jgi:hypothetical protein